MTDNMKTEAEKTEDAAAPAAAEKPAAPATPQMTEADDRALRRIGYVLGGVTVFCAGMGIYTGFVAPTAPRNDFNSRAEISRRAVQSSQSSYVVKISSAQFAQRR